jgi:hypothetical protein
MSNCSGKGENENCYYCLGSGIAGKRKKFIKFIHIDKESEKNDSSKLSIDDLKLKILAYSVQILKKYKFLLLQEFTDCTDEKKKQKLLEIIDFVTFQLVTHNQYGKGKFKRKQNSKQTAYKIEHSSKNKRNKKKNKKNIKKSTYQSNVNSSHKETLLANKLSNHFKEKSQNQLERKLDGSRDYYQFRESGKFGSHSSHDDYGDESFS